MIRKTSSPSSSSSLAPGYRFHPTDEELVGYYLSRKVRGIPYIHGPISDIDIYKVEPWDLPGKSALKTRDLEWYFFSGLDKKYGNGDRTNRATQQGYWKTTGKDRPVYHKAQVVGMKKTLVYHNGRAPKGLRTNWVMHEYRVTDENLVKKGFPVESYVLCRIFQKSGSGPKNGEQYGAPLVEEEWEIDDFGTGLEMQEGEFCNDGCLDGLQLDQILSTGEDSPSGVVDYQYGGENGNSSEGSPDSNNEARYVSPGVGEFSNCMVTKAEGNQLYEMPAQGEVHQAGVIVPSVGMKAEGNQFYEVPAQEEVQQAVVNVPQVPVGTYEYCGVSQQLEDQKLYLLEEYSQQLTPVKNEYSSEQSKILFSEDTDYILDQPFLDAMDDPQFGEGGAFLEANDLNGPIADVAGDVDNWASFFDSSNDYLNFDDSFMVGDNSALLPGESSALQMDFNGHQLLGSNTDESSSSRLQSTKDCATDVQYPFLKKASCMLESIQAPPAYASEFPSKDAALRLYASPSASHIAAGMIHIQDMGLADRKMDSVSEKDGRYKIVVSFGMSKGADNSTTLQSAVTVHPGKNVAGAFGGWFTSMFLVLILSMALKFGTYIYAQ